MVLTHTEGRDALIHVLTNVFEVGVDHPLALTLGKCGYHDINDIIGMSLADIMALTYEDEQGTEIDLPKPQRYQIAILKQYHCYRSAQGTPIGDDWKSFTAQDYDDFAETLGFDPESYHPKRYLPSSLSHAGEDDSMVFTRSEHQKL